MGKTVAVVVGVEAEKELSGALRRPAIAVLVASCTADKIEKVANTIA
jgi:hypothetical protein